ncbi:hypothetical protein Pint_16293 [Pistacia integerrima]|uniref:Uncharacterized protein n=1 Tax=Pistacia integerrima TaxID=434235 RepID=A0ACC0ZAX5_9ROSI|nr:hypothetical protein Pint_16293 [Pistacia integerrima]
MRRRAADYRRPVRRRFSDWIWVLLGLFLFVGLVLFVLHHNQHEDRGDKIVQLFSSICWVDFGVAYLILKLGMLISVLIFKVSIGLGVLMLY